MKLQSEKHRPRSNRSYKTFNRKTEKWETVEASPTRIDDYIHRGANVGFGKKGYLKKNVWE